MSISVDSGAKAALVVTQPPPSPRSRIQRALNYLTVRIPAKRQGHHKIQACIASPRVARGFHCCSDSQKHIAHVNESGWSTACPHLSCARSEPKKPHQTYRTASRFCGEALIPKARLVCSKSHMADIEDSSHFCSPCDGVFAPGCSWQSGACEQCALCLGH